MTPDPIGLEGGINLFVYVQNNSVNSADPWGLDPTLVDPWLDPTDPRIGKDNPVTRCHVVTHNDPTENLYGAALVGVPLAALISGPVASSAVPTILAGKYGNRIVPYLPFVPYFVQRWATGYRPWGQSFKTIAIPIWDRYQEGVQKNECPPDYKKGCHSR
jgi:uncharacterized protein RhaS with RHS repeats